MRLFTPSLFLLSALGLSSAYAATVKGRVVDSDRQPLPGATLLLQLLPDSIRAAHTVTDIDGLFNMSDLRTGNYLLTASMTGLEPATRHFELNDTAVVDLGDMVLYENSVTLQEAVVTGVRAAVVAKQDTLEYNAGSFHTNPNANVEDLLKKLPGVEVGSDGTITSGGKTISKILVDGKEFFADDPQLATKNLPSNIVSKVQVIDRKSDAARLTGIDDGDDETVINLTVKKDMNNGWFGNLFAGYGTDGRYEANVNLNYFRNGNQVSLIGGGNNINQLGYGDRGRGRFRDFGGNGGITSSQRIGINFNVGRDEILRVGGNIFYSHSDRDSRQRSETQYLLADSTSYASAGSRTRDKGHNVRADLRLQWNIDEANTIDFRPRFAWNRRDASLNDSSQLRAGDADLTRVNNTVNARTNRGDSYDVSGEFIFNHKVLSHPGRSFSARFSYSLTDTRQDAVSWSDIIYYLNRDDSETLLRYLDNHTWNNQYEGRLTWTEPIGRPNNYLTFSYRLQYRNNDADKLTYNLPIGDYAPPAIMPPLDGVPVNALLSEDLSNRFRNDFMTQELQIGYKRSTKTLNLDAGLTFSPSTSKSEDLINDARNIPRRNVWNVAPFARLRWKMTDRRSFSANYRARTSQPSMTQLQPVPDVTDPLNIIVGNPSLKPTFTQSIMAHFNDFDMDTQRSIVAMANVSGAFNTIVSQTISDPTTGGRTTTYTNTNGQWNMLAMGMINQPFRNRSWRYNARLHVNYANTPNYINGDFNRSGNLGLRPSAGITFSSNVFQMTFNPTYNLGLVTNTLPLQPNRITHAYGFDTDVSLYLPFGLEVATDLSFSTNSGYSAGYNSTQWLWNATISYSLLRDKSLTLSARAYDLLGQKKNITRSVNSASIVDSEYNDLTRYVMFGITWKFNTLSKKVARQPDDMPPGEMPPGGPEREGREGRERRGHFGPPPGGEGHRNH